MGTNIVAPALSLLIPHQSPLAAALGLERQRSEQLSSVSAERGRAALGGSSCCTRPGAAACPARGRAGAARAASGAGRGSRRQASGPRRLAGGRGRELGICRRGRGLEEDAGLGFAGEEEEGAGLGDPMRPSSPFPSSAEPLRCLLYDAPPPRPSSDGPLSRAPPSSCSPAPL